MTSRRRPGNPQISAACRLHRETIVRHVIAQQALGMPARLIVKDLNARGLRTARGLLFNPNNLRQLRWAHRRTDPN